MRLSTLAPAAILLSLFTLPAQADLSSLTGGLTSQLSGATGDCDKQSKELQVKVDAAKASGDALKEKAFQAALDQASKGCKQLNDKAAESQQKSEGASDKQAKASDAGMKALGGLLK